MRIPVRSGAVAFAVGMRNSRTVRARKSIGFQSIRAASDVTVGVASASSVKYWQSAEAIRPEMRQTPRSAGYFDDVGSKYEAEVVPRLAYFAITRR